MRNFAFYFSQSPLLFCAKKKEKKPYKSPIVFNKKTNIFREGTIDITNKLKINVNHINDKREICIFRTRR